MPSGPGTTDANGVYHLGEADNPDGTFSGLMHLVTGAISTATGLILGRLAALEAPPAFSVNRGATQAIGAAAHTLVNSAYGTPTLNSGMTSFSSGVLTIAKTGWYRVSAHVIWPSTATVLVHQILVNSTTPDSSAQIARSYSANGQTTGSSDLVKLNAADVLRLYAYTSSAQNLGTNPNDLNLSVEWVRPV